VKAIEVFASVDDPLVKKSHEAKQPMQALAGCLNQS
jgi:hypothetical protein